MKTALLLKRKGTRLVSVVRQRLNSATVYSHQMKVELIRLANYIYNFLNQPMETSSYPFVRQGQLCGRHLAAVSSESVWLHLQKLRIGCDIFLRVEICLSALVFLSERTFQTSKSAHFYQLVLVVSNVARFYLVAQSTSLSAYMLCFNFLPLMQWH